MSAPVAPQSYRRRPEGDPFDPPSMRAWTRGPDTLVSRDVVVISGSSRMRSAARYGDRPVTGWESLTRAEHAVAALVGEGLPNAEIAERLYISRRTVETHVSRLYQKLQLKGRVTLAMEAAARS